MKTMTSPLIGSMRASRSRTANGCVTHPTSGSFLVDFFFECGAMRNRSDNDIINSFKNAFDEDRINAIKILFWARDIRQGLGERKLFRTLINYIANNDPDSLRDNIQLIPEYGRWDDLLSLFGTNLEDDALDLISENLSKDGGTNPLCAKWMPREKSARRVLATKIRKKMGLSSKEYRVLLSSATSVVENKMCDNEWESISYDKVPSVAMKNYTKAFLRHSPSKFRTYIEDVTSGKTKINSSTLYPHQIVSDMINERSYVSESHDMDKVRSEQWKALPNWLISNPYRILPIVDTSGSMFSQYSANSVRPIDVSVSLGLYIAERNNGPFKDHFITFSESPSIQVVSGESLRDRVRSVSSADWGYSTNLEAVFDLILQSAKQDNILEEDMPNVILVLSDMEFNSCNNNYNSDAISSIKKSYSDFGYNMPNVIFWNLNASGGNFPVKFDDNGTALISGFSPSILKQVLSSGKISPRDIMIEVVESGRYSQIK